MSDPADPFEDISIELLRLRHSAKWTTYPADVTKAVAQNPVAASYAKLLQPALDAAKAAFGHGLHVVLTVAAGVMIGSAVVALVTSERIRSSR